MINKKVKNYLWAFTASLFVTFADAVARIGIASASGCRIFTAFTIKSGCAFTSFLCIAFCSIQAVSISNGTADMSFFHVAVVSFESFIAFASFKWDAIAISTASIFTFIHAFNSCFFTEFSSVSRLTFATLYRIT